VVIRLTTIKRWLWFIAILLMVMSFPIQVYTGSPYPSLLPYAVFGVILVLNAFFPSPALARTEPAPRPSNIAQLLSVYVFLVLLDTSWQAALGFIGPSDAGNAFAVYLLPVVFYWYFRRTASGKEIRAVLAAVAFSGLIVGAYFAYDSFLKLALHEVSAYSKMAFQYSLDRANQTADQANSVRIIAGYRSMGLLESHSVSGAWVILGALAALALLPARRRILRRIIVVAFGMMLLMGLNFTMIIAYAIIAILFEFGAVAILRGRISTRAWRNVLSLGVVIALIVAAAGWVAGDVMSKYMSKAMSAQLEVLLGIGTHQHGMPDLLRENALGYIQHIAEYPVTLLIGDGFATYGEPKGGDVGYIDTLARFGLPLFAVCVYGFAVVVKDGIRYARLAAARSAPDGDSQPGRALMFVVCVLLMILISEGHYSVWGAKSVLPIICFVLALFDRYVVSARSSVVRASVSPALVPNGAA
jgi:hypothetical protein